jgi:hypothetical protein
VFEGVVHLITFSEAQILDLESAGRIRELYPFKPTSNQGIPADTVPEDELVPAPAMPLSRQQRAALIHSSMPVALVAATPRSARKDTAKASKLTRFISKKPTVDDS